MSTKREVLRANLKQWLATKPYSPERHTLVMELSKTLQLHPRSLGRAMKREQMRRTGRSRGAGRPVIYGTEVKAAVRLIYDSMDCICAENIHPEIDTYIHWLVREKQWDFGAEAEALVKGISLGTLKNIVRSFRTKDGTLRGRSSTTPSTLKALVPVRKSHTWVGLPPGHIQMDTVVHCGDLLTGDIVYSVGAVDYATYWSEYTAQWNKGEIATTESTKRIRKRFPFPWCEMHPDSGTEFLNYHFLRFATNEKIAMTRSEPNKKNDNMCIEERNNTIPRRHVGYARIDDVSLVPVVSEILKIACVIHNHFRPVKRMISKTRVGASWHRTFEKKSKTPYARVLEHPALSQVIKDALRKEHDSLNPLELKRKLDTLKAGVTRKLRRIERERITGLVSIQRRKYHR
jgi:uncharacterized protein (DUF736 family)